MKNLTFKIVTPERLVLQEEVDQVTLPTKSGQITVMKDHLPLVASLEAGEIIIKQGEKITPLVVSSGFIEVRDNEVTILADTAERVEEIDIKRAEEARQKAEKLLKEKKVETEDYTALQAKLQKELARLKVARKHKKSRFGEQQIGDNL